MTAPNATIDRTNATRSTYGLASVADDDHQWVIEEDACDQIAELWVKMGRNLSDWKEDYPDMLELFAGEIEYRRGRIDLCGVVDTWEEDFGLTGEDFIRMNREIQAWIVSHASAYGTKA